MRAILDARTGGIGEQLAELRALRGKNQDVVGHMMERVREEKELFERGLARYTALRNVFTQQTNDLFDHIGLETLRANAGKTRRQIEDSPFTRGVRTRDDRLLPPDPGRLRVGRAAVGGDPRHDARDVPRFAKEHGLEPFNPPQFSVLKYQKEIERLERAYNTHFNTLWNMVSKAKFALMRRFFETIASRVKHVYVIANRDVEAWLKAVMSPLETQVREHHLQLRRRLDSIKRIHIASGELEERIAELEQQEESIRQQLKGLQLRQRRNRRHHRSARRPSAGRQRLTFSEVFTDSARRTQFYADVISRHALVTPLGDTIAKRNVGLKFFVWK